MTTQTTTPFPTFNNTANLEGTVYSSDIQLKEYKDAQGNPYNALSGKITVRTGENESHVVQYFVKEKTSKGADNKIFTNVKTVVDELVTIEQIAEGKAPEGATPSKVRVRGELNLNEYYNDADQLQSQLQVRGVFLNRVKDDVEFAPKAEYDIEGIVIKKLDETALVDGEPEETGRKKVTVLIPTYNNALPIEFISPVEHGDYIDDNFETGLTVNLYGSIVNFSKKIEKKISAGFGEDKTEVKYENTREILIRGGSVYDEENVKSINQEQLKELQAKRNIALANTKERSQQRQQNQGSNANKPVGFGGGATSVANSNNKPKVDVSGLF